MAFPKTRCIPQPPEKPFKLRKSVNQSNYAPRRVVLSTVLVSSVSTNSKFSVQLSNRVAVLTQKDASRTSTLIRSHPIHSHRRYVSLFSLCIQHVCNQQSTASAIRALACAAPCLGVRRADHAGNLFIALFLLDSVCVTDSWRTGDRPRHAQPARAYSPLQRSRRTPLAEGESCCEHHRS